MSSLTGNLASTATSASGLLPAATDSLQLSLLPVFRHEQIQGKLRAVLRRAHARAPGRARVEPVAEFKKNRCAATRVGEGQRTRRAKPRSPPKPGGPSGGRAATARRKVIDDRALINKGFRTKGTQSLIVGPPTVTAV